MKKIIYLILITSLVLIESASAQRPYRVGTTAVNFLEIGYGSVGIAMGDALVSSVNDVSGIYWNPAGLAYLKRNEAQVMYQPWIAGINTAFVGIGVVIPSIGTLGLGMINVNYGEMDVTTLEAQDGTGERYQAGEYAFSLSYSRLITEWFAFGASAKYIASNIWHLTASALAIDLGVIVHTRFFSVTGKRADGLKIGMSISNYGTRLKYDGLDLIHPIDILPDESGNYADTPGQYRLSEWELPLIFRIGVSAIVFKHDHHNIKVAVDALHPNNNAESINAGLQYCLSVPGTGQFFLRGGSKGMLLPDSEFGWSFGAGFQKLLMDNMSIRFDYAIRNMGLFGNFHSYSFGFTF